MIKTITPLTRERAEELYEGMGARLDEDHGPVDDANFFVGRHMGNGETRLTLVSASLSDHLGCSCLVYDKDDGWIEVG